jgi:hypothetical protein
MVVDKVVCNSDEISSVCDSDQTIVKILVMIAVAEDVYMIDLAIIGFLNPDGTTPCRENIEPS